MKNIQHSTSNNQHSMVIRRAPNTGCSMLNVECWMFPIPSIPKGLQPSTPGWPRRRTTLGQSPTIFSNPNGVASTRHNTFVRCLKNRLFSSPSPRPSLSGRGRTIRRFSRKSATGFAGHISAKIGMPDRYPLSPRQRVRVRGKQPSN